MTLRGLVAIMLLYQTGDGEGEIARHGSAWSSVAMSTVSRRQQKRGETVGGNSRDLLVLYLLYLGTLVQ